MGEPLIIVTASSILDDQDLSQTSSVLTIKGYLNKLILFIPKLNSKCVFKYPFDCGRKLSLADCFVKTKLYFFVCLATADSISISVSPNKGSCFIIKRN